MNRQKEERTAPPPKLAIRRAVAAEEGTIGALALALSRPAGPPAAPGREDGHARVRGLLADAGRRDLQALRHLLTCPLCWQLARVVLLELPAIERRRHCPFRHHS